MPTITYFSSITNATYHNLCTTQQLPPGTKHLLGLGHKFIPLRTHPAPQIQQSLDEFERNVRLKYFFAGDDTNDTFNKNMKKIYVKSTWTPDHGQPELENRLTNFRHNLMIHAHNNPQRLTPSRNLSRVQYKTLLELKNNKNIIILLADKNLGPVVMDRNTYIQRVLTDHLSDETTYLQLQPTAAEYHLSEIKDQLKSLLSSQSTTAQSSLSTEELTYFDRVFSTHSHRIPTFYGLIKIHKTPYKIRPVVSCCGSLLATVSTWLDFHLQSLRPFLPAFIKDSAEFQQQLQLTPIPSKTNLFTCDAISMYTNIDVSHSIEIISKWFVEFENELPPNFPCNLLLPALEIVMRNNVFSFGNTTWLQQTGTAMGTPCACMLASIYFAYHERTYLLPKYSNNIIFYRRFIDDVFCLWKPDYSLPFSDKIQFEHFQTDVNNFGQLRWEFSPLSMTTTFLDLTVTLLPNPHPTQDNFFYPHFKTFQKPNNLYLYLPPHSGHPPGTIRSLVFGLLKKYWAQNTDPDDFRKITTSLFERLQRRGHNPTKLRTIFTQAAAKLERQRPHPLSPLHPPNPSSNPTNTIFLKWRYHPNDISRSTLRNIYHQNCENSTPNAPNGFKRLETHRNSTMTIDKLTIAYTRDRNLRDLLIPSRLRTSDAHDVNSILANNKGDH